KRRRHSFDERAAGARPRPNCIAIRSADRRRVLDAAFGPQLVQPALDLERRAHADVTLKRFTVIADLLYDTDGPILGQPELLSIIALGPDEALDLRVWQLPRIVESLRGNVQCLGIDHGEERPLHNVVPLVFP